MFCSKCGKEIPPNSNFCPYCNNTIMSGESSSSEIPDIGCCSGCLIIFLGIIILGGIGTALSDFINVISSGPIKYFCIFIVIFALLSWVCIAIKYKGPHMKIIGYGIILAVVVSLIGSYALQSKAYHDNQNFEHSKIKKSESSNKIEYKGIMKANTFYADDYETLIRLSDGLQNKDNDLIAQLLLEGKIHKVKKDTHITIVDTGLLDKNVVSVVFEEGPYDLKSGYTFKDWTQKTSLSNSNNDSSSTISTSSKTTEGTPCTLKAGTPIMKSIELVKKIPTDEKKVKEYEDYLKRSGQYFILNEDSQAICDMPSLEKTNGSEEVKITSGSHAGERVAVPTSYIQK